MNTSTVPLKSRSATAGRLTGENIICVSNSTWAGNYTKSTVQLLSQLASENRVLFVEYPYTWKDVWDVLRGKKDLPLRRMLGLRDRLSRIELPDGSGLWQLIVPPMLPFAFARSGWLFRFLLRCNAAVYRRCVVTHSKRLKIKEPVVLNAYNPLYGIYLRGKLREKLTVYYCFDVTETYRYGRHIVPIEEQFTREADLVITSSDFLNIQKNLSNKHSYVVKNGVDYDLFSPHARKSVATDRIRRKVGYIGSLDNRFDIEAVACAIRQQPGLDFEFTGEVRNPAIREQLSEFPNVWFHRPVRPDKVPRLLAQYDIALIPYRKNDQNRNIYPLKINEYLAIGLPVVITDFADLPEFADLVYTARTPEEFARCIDLALAEDSPELIVRRIAHARTCSWTQKARDFGALIRARLNEKLLAEPSSSDPAEQ